jgi:hypothetical protein
MKARLMTRREIPLFTEHGVSLNNERWTPVDFEKLTPEDRRGIVAARGRIVLVHEADEQVFANLADSIAFEATEKKSKK